jgi:uncharacterized protein YegP (UPF0339 family)
LTDVFRAKVTSVSSRRVLWLLLGVAVFTAMSLIWANPAEAAGDDPADEVLFYREDGLFRYYDIKPDGGLPQPMVAGDGYTKGWTSITAIDLDGGGQDEIFFYREDGLFRFYNIRPNAQVGTPILAGDGYTSGWSSITAVDLDGDGQDEMFFYRDDGLFRYYNVKSNGQVGTPIRAGDGYTSGWDVISAIDLDGDGQDEMFFYRSDGLYRFYNVSASGSLGEPILAGEGYTPDWTSISAIDLDGDRRDEMFFYREDGLYRYYDVSSNGNLGTPLVAGSNYTTGWSSITAINLQGDYPTERVSRFTTFFNCCEPRVTNIRTIAAAVNGTVVQPGETFSIDKVVGARTSEKGYVPAGYLVGGVGQCCAVGGGVSQFGTTIHNAVFWGGYQIDFHRPHTGWIPRYPLGIEATLVYKSIDYRFTNNTVTPVTIRTSSTSTSVTVELWGYQGGWQMSGHHPPGNRSSSVSVLDAGGSQAKRVGASVSGSAPGQVRIVRTLTQGGSRSTQTWFWNYLS